MRDHSDPSGDDLPLEAVKLQRNEEGRKDELVSHNTRIPPISLPDTAKKKGSQMWRILKSIRVRCLVLLVLPKHHQPK